MLPLFHDFSDETVLVFGGGRVGLRKARFFAQEANVIVVSTEFADELRVASQIRAHVAPDSLSDWFDRTDPALVVAATDDGALNEAIERSARERGILINRADQHGARDIGSIVVPATVRDGDVVTAIGTGGRSPALSKQLRRQIEPLLRGADSMADLTAVLREELKERGISTEKRRQAIHAVVKSESVWGAIEDERDGNGDSGGTDARAEAERVVSDSLNRD
ncbi:precorrin-2 dehydrogenase/sirohydrochlorin ferrochelatase family protein [Haladaptatus sp. DFWS20]|uniref:precorrin-2 dehydrogenase/sirohydrochlorin ferrochelatase family protein n=1 Tax=Haladaptatus sp. DFWS20 TaxID=3403467 RepID=UPI003EBE439B